MTTTLVTLTGDVTDAIGSDFDPRRTKAYVRHNTPKVVTDDGPIHLGGGTVNVNSDGTFELPNVVASTSLVENLQATVYVDYADTSTRQRATATFGPYDLSGETGTVDIRDLEAVQALDPSFASETMSAMQVLRDDVEAISGLTGEDDAVALLVNTPTSDTAAALSASITDIAPEAVGVEKRAAAGSYTTGNVMLFGDHAYAPAGIATAAVFGGALNYENVVGGNTANVNTATSNLSGAAALTGQDGNWNFIHGGYDNVVNGWACSVMGYHCKVTAGANHCTIGGGSLHNISTAIAYGTIAGGSGNTLTGDRSTIGGGAGHTAAAQATVAGGNINTASGSNASIGGGNNNTAAGNNASIPGGTNVTASGTSALAAGQFTTASGTASVALGRENTAAAPASTALGRDVSIPTNLDHAIGHGAGKFSTAGDAQVLRLVAKRQTTDATPAALRLDGTVGGVSIPLTVPADTCWAFRIMVAARNTGANENAAYEVRGAIRRDTASASTTALVGTPTVTVLGEDAAATAWDVAVSASTSLGALEITVSGEAAKTIRWVASVELTQVQG